MPARSSPRGTPRELKAAHGRSKITFEHDGDITAFSHVLDGADGIEIGFEARGRMVASLDTAASGDDGTLRILDRIRAAGVSPTHSTPPDRRQQCFANQPRVALIS
jgi:hypothetical protein